MKARDQAESIIQLCQLAVELLAAQKFNEAVLTIKTAETNARELKEYFAE